MRCVFFFILSLFTMDAIHAQFSDKRQLLIFGEAQSAAVQQQLALLNKEAKGLQERDLQVVPAADRHHLYKKYRVGAAEPFVLVLVGKDGGEKYRSPKPVFPDTIFAIIDAMPMRQSEMKRRKQEE